ncbi:MAG: TrkH family potassium uptake protein [Candidatus Omnitrophica bacterium]|nr:TrkH family potassium uptake protein [Candidatus Omnitrophota bacterium]
MVLKPQIEDIKIIGFYSGKIIISLSLIMLLPILCGLFFKETQPVLDFTISMGITYLFGLLLTRLCYTNKELNWMQGMIVVSLSWLFAMFFGAFPLFLSGHWNSYLDACFDAMSGFATTGLTLVKDLDHLSYTHNFWRHLTIFIGGQGIVIIALSVFTKGFIGAFRMYVGEAREEKILPNLIYTARFIWLISIVYLILGTLILATIGIINGLRTKNAFFHGACLFMAAFDTGGFTPQSQSILYYHSLPLEIVTMIIMILGAINFKLHYNVWTNRWKDILKDIETSIFLVTVTITFFITALGITQLSSYSNFTMLFRKGFYQLISAHSGTGYQTIYAYQFSREWGQLALTGIILAMSLGGAVCSTTGAIKMLRIGIIFNAIKEDLKRIMFPERSFLIQKFYHLKDMVLEDKQVRAASLITLSYIILFLLGTLVGVFYGYPFLYSLFESVSASANVGLSCGITNPNMPWGLKLTYIVQMWTGRLEFMSVFTLISFFLAVLKGK